MNGFDSNPDEASNECIADSYVEHLQKKYLTRKNKETQNPQSSCDSTDFSPSEIVACSPSSSLTASEKQHYQRAMGELRSLLKIGQRKLEKSVSDYESSLKKNEEVAELELLKMDQNNSNEDMQDDEATLTQSVTLPTLASDYSESGTDKPRKSVRISLEPTTFLESEFSTGIDGPFHGPGILRVPSNSKKFESTDVKIIHAELMNIHMRLNEKSRDLAMLQTDLMDREEALDDREHQLVIREEELSEREESLAMHEASVERSRGLMARLQGVEVEVEEKFRMLRQCHSTEIERLHSSLAEKIKECKRLKNSFDVLKGQNDELKTQESDLQTSNEKLRIQNQKLKKRLENLQRKQEFDSCKNSLPAQQQQQQILADRTNRSGTSEKQSGAERSVDRTTKVWSNSIEALSVSLDWVSEVHLKPSTETHSLGREMTVDKCLKILPLLVEVIRYLPLCSNHNKLQLPFLRFIYWSLHHLEDTHHGLLSSTARRIGEELVRPTSSRMISENEALSLTTTNQSLSSSITSADNKVKLFFQSGNPEIRMLSSLIIIKTLHQVDVLAQVFQQIKKDLKPESNRKFFLDYSATHALLPYMTYKTNKSLLSCAVDVMLQMSMESNLLPAFLELCSCESWFRAVSSAVRAIGQSGDSPSLEKLSVILQKLSKIKSNKKFFDTFSLGRLLQDHYRDVDPSCTFLSLNLRSILFNLNMIKTI